MALKLMGQVIYVLPLKGRFVKFNFCGNVVGDEVDLIALQNTERLCLDFMEGRLPCDTVIREEFQHLPGLIQVLVALGAVLIHSIFRNPLCCLTISPDVMNEAAHQIVMQSLVSVIHKA